MGSVTHGGKIWQASELSGKPVEEILDFSANINCQGPVDAVMHMFDDAQLMKNLVTHYPDEDYTNLKAALASKFDVDASKIEVGNGATELLALSLKDEKHVLIPSPSYGEYECTCVKHNVKVGHWDFQKIVRDPSVMEMLIATENPTAIVVPLPNNPTAQLIPIDVLLIWFMNYPEINWVIDASFLQFSSEFKSHWNVLKTSSAKVVMSLTKYYAIPGLRLGWMLGSSEQLEPWRVNAIAAEAGFLSLCDRDFDRKSKGWLDIEKSYVVGEWSKRLELYVEVDDIHANFILAKLPESINKEGLITALMARGILVRDAGSFGLENTLRLAIKDHESNKLLLAAYDKIIS